MQLEAHRLGCRIILGDGDERLRDLMAFVGIDDLFDPRPSAEVGQPTNDVASSTGSGRVRRGASFGPAR